MEEVLAFQDLREDKDDAVVYTTEDIPHDPDERGYSLLLAMEKLFWVTNSFAI